MHRTAQSQPPRHRNYSHIICRKILKTLEISSFLWYNMAMKKMNECTISNTETVTISRAEYDAGKAYIAELEQQNNWLMEQLNLLKRKQFGSASEKASAEVMEQMSFLFDEAEVHEHLAETRETTVKGHTRKQKSGSVKDVVPADIRVEEVVHALPAEDRSCPKCGEEMVVIGKEVHEALKIKPAEAYIVRDIYYTYACRKCEKQDITTPVVKTPKEPSVIPGSFASAEAVAYLATQKFVMGSPLYRQAAEWDSKGVKLSRQTMSNWLLRCSKDWLEPVYDVLHRELVKHDLLHADETELQVLHEPGKSPKSKSYMWLYRTGGDAAQPVVLYEYQSGRGGSNPKEFLRDFRGYLQTDGYAGYHAVDDVIHVGCFAHARRKFEESMKAMPKGKRSPTAEQGVAYCTKLFELEAEYEEQQLSYEQRKQQRLERSKPILDAMLAWANTRSAAPKSKLGDALNYLKNQWKPLNHFLLDGRLEISNNRAERSIKPFVMSRKNFLFANTPLGAKGSAVIFSLIETAKENGLDPYRYLVWVLDTAPKLSQSDASWAEKLLPSLAPVDCKNP